MYDYKTGESRSNEFVDDQDRFDYYDYLTQVTYLNLKHYAGITKGIHFGPIDINDKEHKFLLHIALRVAIFDDDIKVRIPNLNIFQFYKFIIKEFGYKAIRYFGRRGLRTILPAEILSFQATGNDIPQSMFGDIYTAYYEKGGVVYAL